MFKKVTKYKKVDSIDDVICDICGNSCDMGPIFIDKKESRKMKVCHITNTPYIKRDQDKNFEYLTMNAKWGYNSVYDLEEWNAHICQNCVQEHLLKFVKFKSTQYRLL